MKLYGYFRSSAAYRLRIAMNLKGLDYDFQSVHLRKDGGQQFSKDYKQLNPQALVPSLVTDDGDVLTQSIAIIDYINTIHPNPPLLPDDPVLLAKVKAFSLAIACDIHPLQNLRVLEMLKNEFALDNLQIDTWLKKWIGDGLLALENKLKQDGMDYDFCYGDKPSLADICLIPQIFSALRFHVPLVNVPKLMAIYNHAGQFDAFEKASPKNQPDWEK